ncbi:hypothetical protein CWI75_08125 [Kineobactrum sediminis]|uniref:DUF2971 domain-containing protein n=2 Tax=Kineobactrum sediminis TaxID=1905677 RepID=A0A2N5Y4P9_9GAMM|nr:hypothetical protein CWI75_08125 [Kineobactrum sediminis]
MGVDKFFDLILNEHLVFNRADNFTDKNELLFDWISLDQHASGNELKQTEFDQRCKSLKESAFVSSWSAQKNESFGLWKVYLGGNNPGVAIKTNYQDLIKSFPSSRFDIVSGRVRYHTPTRGKAFDYMVQLDDEQLIGTKYAGYSYEHEVRLFLIPPSTNFGGQKIVQIPVSLDSLIHEIWLSPWIASWFQSTFNEIVDRLRPSILERIRPSRLNDNG